MRRGPERALLRQAASLPSWLGLLCACLTATAAVHVAPTRAHAASLDKAEKAAAFSIIARDKAREKNFKACAEFYHQAAALDPSQGGYLYSAARCEQKSQQYAAAAKNYRRFLKGADESSGLAAKARSHLAECQRALEKRRAHQAALRLAAQRAAARKAAAQAAKARGKGAGSGVGVNKGAAAPTNVTAWSTIGGGVVLAGVGGWLLVSAAGIISDLEPKLRPGAGGTIDGISYDDATAEQSRANVRQGTGIALIAAGVVAGGVGAWMLLDSPKRRVTLVPTGRGGLLRVSF